MKIVYGVSWIEVEFGERPEGWALFLDRDQCVSDSRKAIKDGFSDGGYLGPERPFSTAYVEIPFESLEENLQQELEAKGKAHTPDRWEPKFRGKSVPF